MVPEKGLRPEWLSIPSPAHQAGQLCLPFARKAIETKLRRKLEGKESVPEKVIPELRTLVMEPITSSKWEWWLR